MSRVAPDETVTPAVEPRAWGVVSLMEMNLHNNPRLALTEKDKLTTSILPKEDLVCHEC
jgi:hypothetical protein